MESFMSLSSQLIPDIDGRSIGHAVLCSRCLEIMSSWSDEWQAPQWGKMSWTGNRRSSRLMMLAVIICRCEWSQINHLGVRFELHWVKNGNDQTCGNGNRWALLKKKKKKRKGKIIMLSMLPGVSGRSLKTCWLGGWDLCSLWSRLLFNNHTDVFLQTLNNNKLHLS